MKHPLIDFWRLWILILLAVPPLYAEENDSLSAAEKLAKLLNLDNVVDSLANKQTSNTKLNNETEKQKSSIPENLKDSKHGVAMGIPSPDCDNAKDKLFVDWDFSPVNYTCYSKFPDKVNKDIDPIISCDTIKPDYVPQHYCMDVPVQYNSTIPTHEGHRPLWPVFGEYQFVPPQRWLHNVEHGAIILLYHPCAEPGEVQHLKRLVKSCTWKYVITPWNMLPRDTPLVLVAWGCRLQMTHVDTSVVRYFIRNKAFRGPEAHYLKQGQYNFGLLERSNPPENVEKDKVLC